MKIAASAATLLLLTALAVTQPGPWGSSAQGSGSVDAPAQRPSPPHSNDLSASAGGSHGDSGTNDFGSGGSGESSDGGDTSATTAPWTPTPTPTSDGNGDWWWYHPATPTPEPTPWTGDGKYGDDEVYFPGIDGSIDAAKRTPYYFDKRQGFDANMTSDASTGVVPGNCPYAFCVHFVFESDYGGMTPFDAFVLDRYESPMGPYEFHSRWGALPLVLGHLSEATRQKIQGNWTDQVFNWNETRRTTWTLHPQWWQRPQTNEIDLTLYLRQLHTFLPGYEGVANETTGPFYSSDPTDQLVIRVNGYVNRSSAASAMLPVIVNHTGSQLVDINMTSSLLFQGDGAYGGNELQLTFKLSRRKFGGITPWFPAKPSSECEVCSSYRRIPDAFRECFEYHHSPVNQIYQDLLSFRNNRRDVDVKSAAEACFSAIVSGDWTNGTNTSQTTRFWNGWQWVDYRQATWEDVNTRWDLLRKTDGGLRCWAESQCPMGGATVKSDAEVVVLRHEPARTSIHFNESWYNFYLQMGLKGIAGQGLITTPVIMSSTPVDEIAEMITRSFPDADQLQLKIEVSKYNNSDWVQKVIESNKRAIDEYERASGWSGTSNSRGSESGDGSAGSRGDAGTGWEYNPWWRYNPGSRDGGSEGPSASGSTDGSAGNVDDRWEWSRPKDNSDDGSARRSDDSSWRASRDDSRSASNAGDSSRAWSGDWSWDSAGYPYTTQRPRPAKPWLQPVPKEDYMIEIIARNITVTPYVVAVFVNAGNVSYWSTDSTLKFEVARLDVNKFHYVPPPPNLDLTWQREEPEPSWMAEVRRHMPTFDSSDACSQCKEAYVACLFDLDCAFGVNDYLNYALRWDHLKHRVRATAKTGGQSGVLYQVNITDRLRDARPFFPAHGFAKFQDVVRCMAATMCNLDDDRWIYYNSNGQYLPANATTFVTTPAEMEVSAEDGDKLDILYDGRWFKYTVDVQHSDDDDFRLFIRDTVNVSNVDTFQSTTNSGSVRLLIISDTDFGDRLSVIVNRGSSTVTYKPSTTLIQAYREDRVDANNGWTALQWPRLQQWLDVFWYVPASSHQGWTNDTDWSDDSSWGDDSDSSSGSGRGNSSDRSTNSSTSGGTTNGSYPSPTPLPPPQSPTISSAVCPPCATLVRECLSDVTCVQAVAVFVPKVLPKSRLAGRQGQWSLRKWVMEPFFNFSIVMPITNEPIEKKYRDHLLALASCLATHDCPVGASKGVEALMGSIVYPTTVEFAGERFVRIAVNTSVMVHYKDLPPIQISPENSYWAFREYFGSIAARYGVRPAVKSNIRMTNWTGVVLMGTFEELDNLALDIIDDQENIDGRRSEVYPVKYDAGFKNGEGIEPTWEYLSAWYGLIDASIDPLCSDCLPRIKACYEDADCWQGIQDVVIPVLTASPPIPWMSSFNPLDGKIIYDVALENVLYDQMFSGPFGGVVVPFPTPWSWQLFSEILRCFAVYECDVESMNSAMEPPATAHIPSLLKMQPAFAELRLYMNSRLRVELIGQTFDYTETGSGSVEPLASLLDTAMRGVNTSVSVNLTEHGRGLLPFIYNISFADDYFGRLPRLTILARGDVPSDASDEPHASLKSWKIDIRSLNQAPRWDKLTHLLSSPLSTSYPLQSDYFRCEAGVAIRDACYRSFECYYGLSTAIRLMETRFYNMTSIQEYDPNTQLFEVDLLPDFHMGFFNNLPSSMELLALEVLRESARCASQALPSFAAQPFYQDARISFTIPAQSLNVTVHGADPFVGWGYYDMYILQSERDPNFTNSVNFEDFIVNAIRSAGVANVRVSHRSTVLPNGALHHDLEFTPFAPVFVLRAFDPERNQTVVETSSRVKVGLRSPTIAFDDTLASWVYWLHAPLRVAE